MLNQVEIRIDLNLSKSLVNPNYLREYQLHGVFLMPSGCEVVALAMPYFIKVKDSGQAFKINNIT